MQRRRRPDLNINVVPAPNIAIVEQRRDDTDAVPTPQTPPNQKPALKSSLKAAQPSNWGHKQPPPVSIGSKHAGGAFLEDKTPTSLEDMYITNTSDNGGGRPNPRDSHDLSVPARTTRDSLVTNMLLSLDQMSMGQMTNTRQTYEDLYNSPTLTETTSRPMFFSTTKPAANTSSSQGHSYSYSSDLDGTDTESKASSHAGYHRYRRSNSSSNFQMSLARINSMRETSQKSLPATPPRHGPAHHSRSRKGSKGSSSNSLDAGYPPNISTQRRASNINVLNGPIRSSSYDQPTKPPKNDGGRVAGGQSGWQMDFTNANLFNGADGSRSNFVPNADEDEHDVAPTPNIPGGPRRLNAVPSLPNFPPPSSHSQSFVRPKSPAIPSAADPERNRSTRSTRSATVGGRSRAKSSASSREVPPLPAGGAPALDADSAPAPNVGYEKSKGQPVHAGVKGPSATPSSSQQPKEKIGFFRRVFGGRRDNASPTDSPTSKTASSPHSRKESADQKAQMKLRSTPPSRDSEHSGSNTPVQSSYGTLQKKTSSFFRRHKKQQEEAPPLPAPAPQVIPSPPTTTVDESSSLLPPRLASPPKPEYSPGLTRALEPYLISSTGPSPVRDVAGTDSYPSRYSPADTAASPDTTIDVPRDGPMGPASSNATRGFSRSDERLATSSDRNVESQTPRRYDDSVAAGNADTPQRQTPLQSNQMIRAGFFLSDSDSEGSPQRPSRASDKTFRLKIADPKKLVLPIEGPALEAVSVESKKSTASLPSVKIDKVEPEKHPQKRSQKSPTSTSTMTTPTTTPIDEPDFVVGQPTPDDRQKAQKIFDGNEDFITKEKAAAWMGEEGPVRQRTLHVYMSLFDFSNRSIVASLRDVCNRLILRGETQQVDRILSAFATRWCDCNPDHGFKAIDVVHTICYSIMLLNTDLHMADIESKMTRSQFVKNTMGTIRQSLADAAPDAFGRQSILPGKNSTLSPEDSRTSVDQEKSNFRNSFLGSISVTGREGGNEADECGPLVKAPFEGTLRAWEAQVEVVLKDTYQSIRDQRLPLFGAGPQLNSQSSLSVMGMLKRSPSVLSKAPSEGHISTRGRINESSRPPATTSRWTSKSRSRARAQLGANGFSSSRTSFEDNNSLWSPSVSSATRSRYSLGRTQTSMSIESVGSSYAGSKFQQSIGFANALSQAIIREDVIGGAGAASLLSMDNNGDEAGSNVGDGERPLLEDESLELAGPPWVKEGRVIHKHHLDGIDKKAKERNWSEVFAVVQKGTLSMFSFIPNKSMGKKSRGRSHRHDLATMGVGGGGPKSPPVVVGGGNWQDNATNLGTFSLKQTLASALPPPGYSSSRPHVWALSLPTGAVHLFQVGTPEISKEFVTTVNYWSARLSTHPLVGGISNIEYGWSEAIINNPLVTAITEATVAPASIARPGSAAATHGHQSRGSMHSRTGSFRSGSLDFGRSRSASVQSAGMLDRSDAASERGSGRVAYASLHSGRGKLPGDKIHIADWRPPAQSLRASSQSEEGQLATLTAYVASIEEELRQHNALRSPMLLAFSPRSGNASKAMGNWQRKSEYLLRESVKYRTYVDALHEAAQRKEEVYGQRKDE